MLAFSRAFTLCVACEIWFEVSNLASFGRPLAMHAVLGTLFSLCAASYWVRRGLRAALVGCATVLWVRAGSGFPEAANHHLWEALIATALAFLRQDVTEEARLLVQALRWLAVVPLFYSGVQKMAHGLYFRGEFLAWMVSTKESFAAFLGPLLPASELARLRSLRMAAGAGPYRPEGAPLFVLASNLSWLVEISAGAALLIRRLRPVAWIAAVALIAVIEMAAREIFFGSTMASVLMLFARRDLHTRLLPAFVAVYLICLAMVVGLLPRGVFH